MYESKTIMIKSDYLIPTSFVDSDNPAIKTFAGEAIGNARSVKEKAVALYEAVRDSVQYDPYLDYFDPNVFRASGVLNVARGFCIGKSALLAATARAVGIAARPGYADVRNHLTSKRLRDLVDGDTFLWHSYTELFVEGKWVKCTPAFDAALCERAKVAPLEFDGTNDSLFQPFDQTGRRHMEYLNDRGTFDDVPVDAIMADFKKFHPKLCISGRTTASFREEVTST